MLVEVYGEAFKGYVVRGWWGCVYAGPDVGSYVVVDTAVGRLKERNTRRDPRVALAVLDWEDPYTYVEIRIGFKLFLMLSIIFFLLLSW
jgi:hypothetical protein